MRRKILIALCAALLLCAGCGKDTEETQAQPVAADASMRNTVLYYEDENELLVPVMKPIAWEEGIGKAALSHLTCTPENLQSAASLGLEPVLDADTQFELRIENGLAKVNLKGLDAFESAQQEQNAIAAVVNTLCEFPAIEQVQVLIEGKEGVQMKQGTDLSLPFGRMDLNVEAAGMLSESIENKVTLYFASSDGRCNVPVTRHLYDEPDLYQAVLELIKGPGDLTALQNCFPAGTELLDAEIKDGVATVNLSREFEQIREHEELQQRALETIRLTCQEFEGVEEVRVEVKGREFEPDVATLSGAYVNELSSYH